MTFSHYFSIVIGGAVFGLGLALSGAARPEITLSFLRLEDFGLLLVMGAALVIVLTTYQLLPRIKQQSVLGDTFSPRVGEVKKETVFGAVIFGIGWGISGLCPGTAFAALGMGNWPVLLGVMAMFVGALLYGLYKQRL